MEEEETPGVITAPLPPQIIEKGIATAGLAHLKNYEGYIQSDGLATCDVELADHRAIHAGCWSHARRKFYETAKNTSSSSNSTKRQRRAAMIHTGIYDPSAIDRNR